MKTILCGDVLEHTNSHRRGCVVEVGRTYRDGTTEYHIQPSRDARFDTKPIWWNSAHVRRVPRRDPYRRYLALVAIEDCPAKQQRRQHPQEGHRSWARRGRTFGTWLPDTAWDKLFWRLRNQQKLDPSGEYVHYDLGRSSWEKAAVECLERRDRASCWWYTSQKITDK